MSIQRARVVEPFHGQAVHDGGIANQSDGSATLGVVFAVVPLTLKRVAPGHTHSGRYASACVAHAEQIERGFAGLGEACHAAGLPKGRQTVRATREDFVGVALVSHIEQQSVVFEVEDPVQGHGEFDDPEVWGQVATGGHHLVDDGFTNLLGKSWQLFRGKAPEIGGAGNGGQERSRHGLILGLQEA